MNKKETEYFKKRLVQEKTELEGEMSEIGEKVPGANGDWEATTKDIEVDSADENEVGDKLEEYEGNAGILKQLENQLHEVTAALDRIEKGTYGKCEKCGKDIEKERLEANPSARVSLKHSHN